MQHSKSLPSTDTRLPPKTEKVGFLDLPNEIRNTIYQLAIYDHDRGVVFLPRALPRKVMPGTDDDITYDKYAGTATQFGQRVISHLELKPTIVLPASSGQDLSAGLWVDDDVTKGLDDSSDEANSDDDSESGSSTSSWERADDDRDEDEELATGVFKRASVAALFVDVQSSVEQSQEALADLDRARSCGGKLGIMKCTCDCHDDEDPDDDSDFDGNVRDPPAACVQGECEDLNCEFCAGHGLAADENESNYANDSDEDPAPQDDDEEHFDSLEKAGVLYETSEPGILLTCKEVREQCMPVYLGTNAFSWRFYWLDYKRSYERFADWAAVSVGDHAKLVKNLSFEGRHAVEEGLEFEADIDIIEESPFFETRVECHHVEDEHTEMICKTLRRDLERVLTKMARREGTGIKFTAEDICLVGKLFVKAMNLEPERDWLDLLDI